MDLEALLHTLTGNGPWVVIAFVVLIVVARIAKRKSTTPDTLPAPRVGEYWMAEVPYRDGQGAKDRPCLVIGASQNSTYTVLYMTSRDRSGHDAFIEVDTRRWQGAVRKKSSFLQIKGLHGDDAAIELDFSKFRRRLGSWNRAEAKAVNAALRQLESRRSQSRQCGALSLESRDF